MNILITGARGFMGKNLRSALTGRCGDAHRLMLLDMPHTEEELLAAAAEQGCALRKARLLDLGDGVVKHGSVPQLRRMLGLDAEGMAKTVEDMLHEEDPT